MLLVLQELCLQEAPTGPCQGFMSVTQATNHSSFLKDKLNTFHSLNDLLDARMQLLPSGHLICAFRRLEELGRVYGHPHPSWLQAICSSQGLEKAL